MKSHAAGDLTRDCLVFLWDRQVLSFGCFVFEIWVLRFPDLGALFSRFRCSVFKVLVLRFRDLGASFSRFGCFVSSFGCFVFEIWVLRASVFVFETTQRIYNVNKQKSLEWMPLHIRSV